MSGNLLRYAQDYASPDNPLTVGAPTWADAAQWHAQNLQDTMQAARDPAMWQDAARQYGNALLLGTSGPGFRAPIRPASESVGRAMDATFEYGKDLGPRVVPIDSLQGGTSASKTEATRVADLKDKISGPNGYISRLIVDSDGNVIEGQHRLEALRQLGAKVVPVHVVHDLASGVDMDAMQSAIKDAQTMHGDQRHQLIGHILNLAHEEGSPAAVRATYDPPQGYAPAWNAALDTLERAQ